MTSRTSASTLDALTKAANMEIMELSKVISISSAACLSKLRLLLTVAVSIRAAWSSVLAVNQNYGWPAHITLSQKSGHNAHSTSCSVAEDEALRATKRKGC